jgi:SpoIIAA-like
MVNHELRRDAGILVLIPEGPLEAADFTVLASQIDTYVERHDALRGVLIRAKSFPGWKDFDAVFAHLKFLKGHIHRIERVAVAADGAFANIMPALAEHFVHADVRHFDFADEEAALAWLMSDGANMRSAA